MTNRWIVTMLATLLAALQSPTAWPADETARAEIEAARQQLDEAARHLAELHRKYSAEQGRDYTMGVIGNRAMLGVLLGGMASNGVPIAGVTPGSGAEEAGLMAGDVIVAIDGLDLAAGGMAAMRALRGAIAELSPGETVSIEYLRDGGSNLASVTTREEGHHVMNMMEAPRVASFASAVPLPADATTATMPRAMAGTVAFGAGPGPGLRLHDLGPELGRYFGVDAGVLVLSASDPGGVQPGDVIQEIDGQPVADMGEVLMTMTQSPDVMVVTVLRDGGVMTVDLEPGGAGWYGNESRAIRVIDMGDAEAAADVEILTNN
jgi:predicted metalloprotease with PDZ domain